MGAWRSGLGREGVGGTAALLPFLFIQVVSALHKIHNALYSGRKTFLSSSGAVICIPCEGFFHSLCASIFLDFSTSFPLLAATLSVDIFEIRQNTFDARD